MSIITPPRWVSSTLCLSGTSYVNSYKLAVLSKLTTVTAEAWFRVTTLAGIQSIVSNADGNNGGQFTLYLDNGLPSAYVSIPPYVIHGATAITVNDWHHIASTFDNSTKKLTLYVDGVMAAQQTFSGTPSSVVGNLLIGAGVQNGTNTAYLQGEIGRVMIWDVVRGPDVILKDAVRLFIYNAVEDPHLLYHVDFSLLPGVDSSGNQAGLGYMGNAGYNINTPALVLTGNAYGNAGSYPDYSIPGNSPYTIEGWFFPNNTSNGVLLSYGTGTAWEYEVVYTNSAVVARRNSDALVLQTNQCVTPMSYYHFAVSYDSTSKALAVYINGNLQAVQYFPSPVTAVPAGTMLIGARLGANGAPSSFFNGAIQNIRIWNVCLTQAEIGQWMYNDVVDDDRLISNYDFTVNPPVDDTDQTTITLLNGAVQTLQQINLDTTYPIIQLGIPLSVNASYLTQEETPAPPPPKGLVAARQPEFFSREHQEYSWNQFTEFPGGTDEDPAASKAQFEAAYAKAHQLWLARPELARVVTRTESNGLIRLVYHGLEADMLIYEGPAGTVTDCQLWWMSFSYTVTVGFLQAIGVVPDAGEIKERISTYLTANPVVVQAIKTLLGNPITVLTALGLLKVIWQEGLLWPLLKLILVSAGWYTIYWVLKKVILYVTGLQAAKTIAGLITWAAQMGVLAGTYKGSCPSVADPEERAPKKRVRARSAQA